jgi:hypothetical protein
MIMGPLRQECRAAPSLSAIERQALSVRAAKFILVILRPQDAPGTPLSAYSEFPLSAQPQAVLTHHAPILSHGEAMRGIDQGRQDTGGRGLPSALLISQQKSEKM